MIITLPITVKNDAPLGYWLTPIVADALARQLGERAFVFYGKLGLKRPTEEAEQIYRDYLDYLQITAAVGTDAAMLPELLQLCDRLLLVGDTVSEEKDCYRCPCGSLELPVRIAHFVKEKTFVRTSGSYVCRVCGELGTVQNVNVRVLRFREQQDFVNGIGIYPSWYRNEVLELQGQIQEQGIPWSKDRPTGIMNNLDPELVWSLLPLLLSCTFEERARIVVTNQVIRQGLVTICLARAINPSFEADLIIMPYIEHPGTIEKWRLERLMTEFGYSGSLIRCMLIGSLGWQTKRAGLFDGLSKIEHRRFHLFERHVHLAEQGNRVPYDLTEALRNLGHQKLAQGLKHVFNPEKFDYTSLAGVL